MIGYLNKYKYEILAGISLAGFLYILGFLGAIIWLFLLFFFAGVVDDNDDDGDQAIIV